MRKHGLSNTDLYHVYLTMKDRCNNSKSKAFKNYGARGIKICKEWSEDFKSFYDWSVRNGYKKGLTLDRINNDGNYSPENCRFVTINIQANNRRSTHFITFEGKTLSVQQWAELLGIKPSTLRSRFNKCGWSPEKALTKPIRGNHYEIHSL